MFYRYQLTAAGCKLGLALVKDNSSQPSTSNENPDPVASTSGLSNHRTESVVTASKSKSTNRSKAKSTATNSSADYGIQVRLYLINQLLVSSIRKGRVVSS